MNKIGDLWQNLYKLPRWQKIAICGGVVLLAIAAYGLMFWGLAAVLAIWWEEIIQAIAVAVGAGALLHVFFGRR